MVQKSCDHQLRLVVCPTINKVLYIPSGAGFLPSTVELLNMSFVGGGNTLFLRTKLDACPSPKKKVESFFVCFFLGEEGFK